MHLRNGEEGPRKPEIRLRWVESGGVEDEKGRGGGGFDIESQFTFGGR